MAQVIPRRKVTSRISVPRLKPTISRLKIKMVLARPDTMVQVMRAVDLAAREKSTTVKKMMKKMTII